MSNKTDKAKKLCSTTICSIQIMRMPKIACNVCVDYGTFLEMLRRLITMFALMFRTVILCQYYAMPGVNGAVTNLISGRLYQG